MKEIYNKEEKIVLAGAKRHQFNKLKRTLEFIEWRRRQYDIVQRRRCAYCKKGIHFKKLHVDHVFPLYEGGLNRLDNFVLSCPKCNIKKWVSTPGKPLWITQRENYLLKEAQLQSIREKQKELVIQLLDEEILTKLDWI